VFTGIVEELGQVVEIEKLASACRLTVRGPLVTSDAGSGDSVAVNGVCLTVVGAADGAFTADVMAETLRRSSLRDVTVGSPVNLERAVRVSDRLGAGSPVNLERAVPVAGRLGGHVVQGHVDGTGELREVRAEQHWSVVRISLPPGLRRYVVEKGSVTVEGISLTVSALGPDWFEVSLIPTTLTRTTLGSARPGDTVNLEVDILAKYVESLLQAGVAAVRESA